jgi:hypothetical protein
MLSATNNGTPFTSGGAVSYLDTFLVTPALNGTGVFLSGQYGINASPVGSLSPTLNTFNFPTDTVYAIDPNNPYSIIYAFSTLWSTYGSPTLPYGTNEIQLLYVDPTITGISIISPNPNPVGGSTAEFQASIDTNTTLTNFYPGYTGVWIVDGDPFNPITGTGPNQATLSYTFTDYNPHTFDFTFTPLDGAPVGASPNATVTASYPPAPVSASNPSPPDSDTLSLYVQLPPGLTIDSTSWTVDTGNGIQQDIAVAFPDVSYPDSTTTVIPIITYAGSTNNGTYIFIFTYITNFTPVQSNPLTITVQAPP